MNVIVLVGLPGSGKSTVAKKYFPNYVRISQDLAGNREACIMDMKAAIKRDYDIIIDRTNINRAQRKYWIDLALGAGAKNLTCIYLDVGEEECIARINIRKGHETIKEDMPLEKKRAIVYNFNKSFERPELKEGFSTVIYTRNYE